MFLSMRNLFTPCAFPSMCEKLLLTSCSCQMIQPTNLINNMSRLLSAQVSDRMKSRLFSRRCLNSFGYKESLEKHKKYCDQHKAVRSKMPKPLTTLTFKNHNRSMRVPFIVHADFESFIKPIDTCQPDPSTSYTKKYQKHTLSSFCYYIKYFENCLYSHDPVTFTV